MILRYLALVAGLLCVGCETYGTYDFLIQDQKGWNYIVMAGVIVAGLAGLLPLYAERARVGGQRLLMLCCWLALPFALVFIFTAAIQRTGGAADMAQQERIKADRNRGLHERSEKEATEALPSARAAALTECASGRGKRCLEAEGKVKAAEDRITAARAELAKSSAVHQDDPMARRLVSMFPFLTEEQVRLYQPLMLPVLVSIFAAIFLALGAHAAPHRKPSQTDEESIRAFMRHLAWDAETPDQIDMGNGQYILKADLRKAAADGRL